MAICCCRLLNQTGVYGLNKLGGEGYGIPVTINVACVGPGLFPMLAATHIVDVLIMLFPVMKLLPVVGSLVVSWYLVAFLRCGFPVSELWARRPHGLTVVVSGWEHGSVFR